jgi:exonuclease III
VSPWTSLQAEEHLINVSQAIYQLNPDILGLQEVFDCTILERLIEKLNHLGATGYKGYLVQGTDTATRQNVALLTRVDPISNLWRTADRVAWPLPGNNCNYNGAGGTSAVSKHFVARFNISGKLYSMFNHHFLAYPTQADRCAQREAQASVMRGLFNNAIANNDAVIVFGDYNDYSDAVPDSADDVPTSRVMRILREGLLEAQPKLKTDPTLYEVSSRVEKANRYTSAYSTNLVSMIDHLLVSTDMMNQYIEANVAHLYPRMTTSDHWPFYLDFFTNASPESKQM